MANRFVEGNRALLLVWSLIVSAVLTVWLDGWYHYFIPCAANCGETFDAIQYIEKFRLYGFKYGLVQEMSEWFTGRPVFYTHNVNVAGILFTFLDAIGLTPFWAKQLFTLGAFGAGLFYVFRATAYHTGSELVGTIVLLLFCTDYEYVLRFGLNALRAWHWLAIFGLMFHVGRLALQPAVKPWLDRMAIAALAALSFGLGYDFWVICFLVSHFLGAFCLSRPLLSGSSFRILLWICVAFALPFVARQIQIATVLGLYFWAADLYYSAVIKVSLLSKILPLPSLDEIDHFYKSAGVLRPSATPAQSLGEILRTFRDMIQHITIPTTGLLSSILAFAVGASALSVTILGSAGRFQEFVRSHALLGIAGNDCRRFLGSSRFIVALMLGIASGMAVFAPLSLHIYLKHQFPLIAAPLHVAKGLVLALAVQKFWTWHSWKRWVAFAAMCLLVFDHLVVQGSDLRANSSTDLSWIGFVSARKEATYAVSGIPSLWVSHFTSKPEGFLSPDEDHEILRRLKDVERALNLSGYFRFSICDQKSNPQTYRQADFWIYATKSFEPQFDRPSPVCRQDYLTAQVKRLYETIEKDTTPKWKTLGLWPTRLQPGGIISILGEIETAGAFVAKVQLVEGDQVVADLIYNCQYRTAMGIYKIPADASYGVKTLQIRVVGYDGQNFDAGTSHFTVEEAPPPSAYPPLPPVRMSAPSLRQIIEAAEQRSIRIAERGAGYVIFDLRSIYNLER